MKLRVVVSVLAVLMIAGAASANLLVNGSFEEGTGQGGHLDAAAITGWTWWGGGWWANDAGAVEDGDWAVKRWESGTGMYQDFTATANTAYDISLFGYDGSAEPLVDRYLNLSVEWFDAGNNGLGSSLIGTLSPGGPLDTWTELSGQSVAPDNTSYGRIVIVTGGGGSAAGSLYFDSASVTQAIPEPAALTLLGLGFLGLNYLRRKTRRS